MRGGGEAGWDWEERGDLEAGEGARAEAMRGGSWVPRAWGDFRMYAPGGRERAGRLGGAGAPLGQREDKGVRIRGEGDPGPRAGAGELFVVRGGRDLVWKTLTAAGPAPPPKRGALNRPLQPVHRSIKAPLVDLQLRFLRPFEGMLKALLGTHIPLGASAALLRLTYQDPGDAVTHIEGVLDEVVDAAGGDRVAVVAAEHDLLALLCSETLLDRGADELIPVRHQLFMDVITHITLDLGVVEPALGEEFTSTDPAGLAHRTHDTWI